MTGCFQGFCPVCGGDSFRVTQVLWPALISAWDLSADEAAYIDRQQGMACTSCGNNLRSMALAAAILDLFEDPGTLESFCTPANYLRVLEINPCGSLTAWLSRIPAHRLVAYPAFDMQALAVESSSFDLVMHSDTLEHVQDPLLGLKECRRVLRPGGRCIFTVPIVAGRLSRQRAGMEASYHCSPDTADANQMVHTEFGADFWTLVMRAGFRTCNLFNFEFPAAIAVIAGK